MDPQQAKAELDIQERVKILPQEIIDLIIGGPLDAVVSDLQKKYALSPLQTKLLENEIILVLALFLDPNTFVNNIQESLEVDRPTAEAIGAEVSSELFELVDDIIALVMNARREIQSADGDGNQLASTEKKNDLKRLAQTFAQPAPIPQPPDKQKTATAEAKTYMEKVEPLRTMEGDINRIHGYGAQPHTEDAIENAQSEDTK